ncbi:MAG: glycosyltransferase [Lachnospiraceae bacterium]|nr:glycosyltransferase [Lachnospiraceae bacterium]
MKTVSVITICRNEEKGIKNTMDSVLAQEWTDFEYIVKDGASTDDTVIIAESYKEAFEKKGIALRIISDPDKGIFDAMNRAAGEADGEWVIFMNAGDAFHSKNTLKLIFDGKKYDKADLLYGDTLEEEFGEFYYFRKFPDRIKERMPFSHQSVFARKELLREFPFDLNYPIAADYNFLLCAYNAGKVFKDTGVCVAVVTKDGVSSVKLKDTYLESIRLRRDRGIEQPTDEEIKKGMWKIDIKQFVMDHFPAWSKYIVRRIQRKIRHQYTIEYKKDF